MSEQKTLRREHVEDQNLKPLKLKYFASMREEIGCSEEEVIADARTPEDLYGMLRDLYPIGFETDELQVAVNHELSTWTTELDPGDTVAFLPPVAGG